MIIKVPLLMLTTLSIRNMIIRSNTNLLRVIISKTIIQIMLKDKNKLYQIIMMQEIKMLIISINQATKKINHQDLVRITI